MNILLVEDDYDSGVQILSFLRDDLNHNVEYCDNGYDALELLKKQRFNLVFSDIKMPRMSGLELLRKIHFSSSGKSTDVVLFTGYGDMDSVIEALRLGAFDYLLKPINIKDLEKLITRINEREKNNQAANKEEKYTNSSHKSQDKQGKMYIFSDCMKNIVKHADILHNNRAIIVLLQGETGTGKELIARHIHFGNQNLSTPFVDINCAALTQSVFESELFGYEAGAYTGALSGGQKGKIDIAKGGTLFLDEITELPIEFQSKLLRVLQEKEFYRVGGLKKIKTDVRIICATNTNIEERVKLGKFRKDLYYRLNVGRIIIPPLRERIEDILPLAKMFLNDFSRQKGKSFSKIDTRVEELFISYNWPGNIRELKNSIEIIVTMFDDIELRPEHLEVLPQYKSNYFTEDSLRIIKNPINLPKEKLDLTTLNNEIIIKALEMHNGNKAETARYLGISRRTLYRKINEMQ